MKHTLLIKDWLSSFLSLAISPLLRCLWPAVSERVKNVSVQYVISIYPVLIIIFEKIIR